MSKISYDAEVRKGRRLMITSWQRTNYIVTGPYFTLRDFWVYEKFAEFLDEVKSPYKDYVDKHGNRAEMREFIEYHHEEFAEWLVIEGYLAIEPKDILRLNYRTQMEYTEGDSI